jgi:hypothetical protein
MLDTNKWYNLNIMPNKNWIWCMSSIAIPWINNRLHRITKNREINFQLPELKKWRYSLTCWMWMIHGYLVVK